MTLPVKNFAPRWILALFALAACACQPRDDAAAPPLSADETTTQNEIAPEAFAEPAPTPQPQPVFVHDKSPQISILLYHEFINRGSPTDMAIPTAVFREQMQRIKDSGHHVVSMEDFLSWKRGEKNLPDPCFLITMDDGWRSVYTEAFPILKEYGFPFTIFLYTNYIASGSKSLTIEQIKEMMAHGASIGCHSRSHPYPAAVRAALAKGPVEAEDFLRKEMVESAAKIESLLGVRPKAYAYPGGFHLPEMAPFAQEAGYEALFTVNPAKVTWETPPGEIHRYVIHGKAASTYVAATTFRGIPLGRRLIDADGRELKLHVSPAEGEVIAARQPDLSADLSPIADLDPASVMMRVSGLGRVTPEFDPQTKILKYRVPVRLRQDECSVYVYWKRLGENEYDAPMVWKFSLDRRASLLGEIPPPPKNIKLPPASAIPDTALHTQGSSPEQLVR